MKNILKKIMVTISNTSKIHVSYYFLNEKTCLGFYFNLKNKGNKDLPLETGNRNFNRKKERNIEEP